MSDWSNEEILKFLERYQGEPCIWDTGHPDHKYNKKKADAWSRLSAAFSKSVKELKNKKEILMVTFRKHLKRKQDCIRSGAATGDIYQPNWFAYQFMESFLLPIYTAKSGLNSEMQSRSSETSYEAEDTENHINLTVPSTSAAEQQMATAFSNLTNVLNQRQAKSDEDECDLYARLLAHRMRGLPKDEQKLLMYEIDGLFIQRIKRRRESPSPQISADSRPSSASSGYVLINRGERTPTSLPVTEAIDDNITIYVDESNASNPNNNNILIYHL
ncbi:unnamed protein product [Acanthoscelides obtectus]|nr:unnamed protein product [Acanthoscelides obtectus]CAK1670273.1 hypothetical protein AOBTE_LOCUS27524 [Acanthoscelides obtectus]